MRKRFFICLVSIFFFSFGIVNRASAVTASQTYHNYLWNAPYNQGTYSLYEPGTRSVGSQLYSGAFVIGRLQFSLPVSMNNLQSNTVLTVQFQLNGYSSQWQTSSFGQSIRARLNATGYNVNSGGCSVESGGESASNKTLTVNCSYSITPQSNSIGEVWVDLGNLSVESGSPWIGCSASGSSCDTDYLFKGNTSDSALRFNYVTYAYQTNPSYSEQQTQVMIEQNQTIIDQNTQIIQGQNNIYDKISDNNDALNHINDSITDSTVTGDFSMPGVPAFGPIASIINAIIDLPRVFLTPPACADLVGPLPIIPEHTFTIPCPSKLLEPYADAVNLAQNLIASYVWFRVAVYILAQVKKLRDPQNDDEEYLNI